MPMIWAFPKVFGHTREVQQDLVQSSNEHLFDSGYAVFDSVLESIARTIGSRPVETGGALVGSYGSSLVVDFIYDQEGDVTGASYVPSTALSGVV